MSVELDYQPAAGDDAKGTYRWTWTNYKEGYPWKGGIITVKSLTFKCSCNAVREVNLCEHVSQFIEGGHDKGLIKSLALQSEKRKTSVLVTIPLMKWRDFVLSVTLSLQFKGGKQYSKVMLPLGETPAVPLVGDMTAVGRKTFQLGLVRRNGTLREIKYLVASWIVMQTAILEDDPECGSFAHGVIDEHLSWISTRDAPKPFTDSCILLTSSCPPCFEAASGPSDTPEF